MIFSLLNQAYVDDEVFTRWLHFLLCIVFRVLSHVYIRVFVCLPRICVPSTSQDNAFVGSFLSSIFTTWPNYVSLLSLIVSSIVSLCPSFFQVTSLPVQSHLVLPAILLICPHYKSCLVRSYPPVFLSVRQWRIDWSVVLLPALIPASSSATISSAYLLRMLVYRFQEHSTCWRCNIYWISSSFFSCIGWL